MSSPETVLVPLDGSAHATAAVPVARGFAKLLHATVAVLHVSDDALTPAALVERMKLSPEDLHGLSLRGGLVQLRRSLCRKQSTGTQP